MNDDKCRITPLINIKVYLWMEQMHTSYIHILIIHHIYSSVCTASPPQPPFFAHQQPRKFPHLAACYLGQLVVIGLSWKPEIDETCNLHCGRTVQYVHLRFRGFLMWSGEALYPCCLTWGYVWITESPWLWSLVCQDHNCAGRFCHSGKSTLVSSLGAFLQH